MGEKPLYTYFDAKGGAIVNNNGRIAYGMVNDLGKGKL